MGYAEDVQAVLDAVEAKVKALGAFPTVLTEYKTPDWDKVTYPVAWIILDTDEIAPIGGRAVEHALPVSVVVVNESADELIRVEDIRENRRLVGLVYDEIMKPPRNLGLDQVQAVEPNAVDPNFNPRAGRIQHWSEFQFKAKLRRVE